MTSFFIYSLPESLVLLQSTQAVSLQSNKTIGYYYIIIFS